MAKNRVIGASGAIPWHLPEDLRRFKRLTMGHHLVMGRRTFESIGRLLPGRTSVIVTRQPRFSVPGAIVAHSFEEAIRACGDDEEIFVIGGADVYRSALPLAERIYLTLVDAQPTGDTTMPEFDRDEWRKIASEDFPADEHHAHGCRHCVLDRIRRT